MKTLKEILKEQGANDQQINSKVVELCENAIAEMGQEEISSVALKRIQELANKYGREVERYSLASNHADRYLSELSEAMREAEQIKAGIVNETRKLEIIPTDETKQAIYLFRNVLYITKEIFGEDISSETMQTAIQAGSYGMWRSIMGESKPNISANRVKF